MKNLKLVVATIALSTLAFAGNQDQISFSAFDTNKDGIITQMEFDLVKASKMTKQADSGKQMKNASNSLDFSKADVNKDGKLTPEELNNEQKNRQAKGAGQNRSKNKQGINGHKKGHIQKNMQKKGNKMSQRRGNKNSKKMNHQRINQQSIPFYKFDANKDGFISATEFDTAKTNQMTKRANDGREMRNAGNTMNFEEVDTNKDGKISKTELQNGRKLMQKKVNKQNGRQGQRKSN